MTARRGEAKRPAKAAPAKAAPAGTAAPPELDADLLARIQRANCPGAGALACFLREVAEHRTEKNDERTNIIDQGAKITYALPPERITQLMRHLEAVRLEGSVAHFSERQGISDAESRCGIMVDFDMIFKGPPPPLTARFYHRVTSILVRRLQRDLNLENPLGAAAGAAAGTGQFVAHVAYIIKPRAVSVEDGFMRYGIHALIPGIGVERAYKRYYLRELRRDPAMANALADAGVLPPPKKEGVGGKEPASEATVGAAACIDLGSAGAPVLFFGSCKATSSEPYVLGSLLEVTLELGSDESPSIRALPSEELEGFNLVHELALTSEAEYEGEGVAPLIRMQTFGMRPGVAAVDYAERSRGMASEEELEATDNALSLLTLADPEARFLHQVLDLLSEEYCSRRNRWRDVIFALAHTSEQYFPLAQWFSQKCARKWAAGRPLKLEELWQDALARRGAPNPITKRSLLFWARECSPDRFRQVEGKGHFRTLMDAVTLYEGRLHHFTIASLIHLMLGNKFCVDVDPAARGPGAYHWYEFVIPGQPMATGEVWKWRLENEPTELLIYISARLPVVIGQVSAWLKDAQDNAREEGLVKYYANIRKTFKLYSGKVLDATFKAGVERECRSLFRRRGFYAALDRDGMMLGVSNGIVRLGAECRLIDHFHEYPVSKYTPVKFRRFDPAHNSYDKRLLEVVADVIPEPDARDWILYYLASSLDGNPKEGLILIWEGGGANGKTSLLKAVAAAMGMYARKVAITLFTSEREAANSPNSALMALKGVRFAYVEELNKAERANVARLKELVNPGKVTGAEKYKTQEDFMMTANFAVASQYSFSIDTTDHGTWRRIDHYTSHVKFTPNPDPKNPLEKKEDPSIVRDLPDDPLWQEAWLAFLIHYRERLHVEYGGQVKNVRSPTIERDTAIYRNSQDALNRFISECIVLSPTHAREYTATELATLYTTWYCRTIAQKVFVSSEIAKELASSAIAKYLKPILNRTHVLVGCRVLSGDRTKPFEDETFIATSGLRTAAPSVKSYGSSPDWWKKKITAPRAPVTVPDDDPLLGVDADNEANWQVRAPTRGANIATDDPFAEFFETVAEDDTVDHVQLVMDSLYDEDEVKVPPSRAPRPRPHAVGLADAVFGDLYDK